MCGKRQRAGILHQHGALAHNFFIKRIGGRQHLSLILIIRNIIKIIVWITADKHSVLASEYSVESIGKNGAAKRRNIQHCDQCDNGNADQQPSSECVIFPYKTKTSHSILPTLLPINASELPCIVRMAAPAMCLMRFNPLSKALSKRDEGYPAC